MKRGRKLPTAIPTSRAKNSLRSLDVQFIRCPRAHLTGEEQRSFCPCGHTQRGSDLVTLKHIHLPWLWFPVASASPADQEGILSRAPRFSPPFHGPSFFGPPSALGCADQAKALQSFRTDCHNEPRGLFFLAPVPDSHVTIALAAVMEPASESAQNCCLNPGLTQETEKAMASDGC